MNKFSIKSLNEKGTKWHNLTTLFEQELPRTTSHEFINTVLSTVKKVFQYSSKINVTLKQLPLIAVAKRQFRKARKALLHRCDTLANTNIILHTDLEWQVLIKQYNKTQDLMKKANSQDISNTILEHITKCNRAYFINRKEWFKSINLNN
jgi:hypothetical protein